MRNVILYIYCIVIMHLSSVIPWGGTPGKGGDFAKGPVKVVNFPLVSGDIQQTNAPPRVASFAAVFSIITQVL